MESDGPPAGGGEIGNAFAHLACHQLGRKWRLPDPVNNAFQAFSSN